MCEADGKVSQHVLQFQRHSVVAAAAAYPYGGKDQKFENGIEGRHFGAMKPCDVGDLSLGFLCNQKRAGWERRRWDLLPFP